MKGLTNTGQISLCPRCYCATYDMLTANGTKHCGKCKCKKEEKKTQKTSEATCKK